MNKLVHVTLSNQPSDSKVLSIPPSKLKSLRFIYLLCIIVITGSVAFIYSAFRPRAINTEITVIEVHNKKKYSNEESIAFKYEKKVQLTNANFDIDNNNSAIKHKKLINKYFIDIDNDLHKDIQIIKNTFTMYNHLQIIDIFEVNHNLFNNNMYHPMKAPYPSILYVPEANGYWVTMNSIAPWTISISFKHGNDLTDFNLIGRSKDFRLINNIQQVREPRLFHFDSFILMTFGYPMSVLNFSAITQLKFDNKSNVIDWNFLSFKTEKNRNIWTNCIEICKTRNTTFELTAKNWSPLVTKNRYDKTTLYFVARHYPLVIMQCELLCDECIVFYKQNVNHEVVDDPELYIRGNTQYLPIFGVKNFQQNMNRRYFFSTLHSHYKHGLLTPKTPDKGNCIYNTLMVVLMFDVNNKYGEILYISEPMSFNYIIDNVIHNITSKIEEFESKTIPIWRINPITKDDVFWMCIQVGFNGNGGYYRMPCLLIKGLYKYLLNALNSSEGFKQYLPTLNGDKNINWRNEYENIMQQFFYSEKLYEYKSRSYQFDTGYRYYYNNCVIRIVLNLAVVVAMNYY
eukprot:436848_1